MTMKEHMHVMTEKNATWREMYEAYCWGIPAPPCADRGCTDSCSTEGKEHWHNILRGSAKPPTSTGESPYYLKIEKGYNKYMEEDHSTPSSHTLLHMAAGLLPMAAAPLSLFFSSLHSHNSLSNISLLYRHFMVNFLQQSKGTIGPIIMPLIVVLVMLPLSHN